MGVSRVSERAEGQAGGRRAECFSRPCQRRRRNAAAKVADAKHPPSQTPGDGVLQRAHSVTESAQRTGCPPSPGVVVGLSPAAHPSAVAIIREVSAVVSLVSCLHSLAPVRVSSPSGRDRPSLIGRPGVVASLVSGAVRQAISWHAASSSRPSFYYGVVGVGSYLWPPAP